MADERVEFRIGNRLMEMPSRDRDVLLVRASKRPDAYLTELCRRIESAGASRQIEIHNLDEPDALHNFLREWIRGEKTPQSIRKLSREVKDELDWQLGPE